jgi:hypothetical protein|tara:strand:- start:56 stop:817 length:762 start_codon:yes stop_codon:yes gene_type:complete
MYKLFILTLLLNSLQTFGQSKKEQIQIITYQLDSINSMLVYERNAHKLKINELNSKISSIDVELVNKNLELDNLKENLVNSENKLAELTQEVGDIKEQNQKLSNSNNLSLDSIGLLNKTILKSQIKIDSLTKEINRLASMKSSKALFYNPSSGDMKYGKSLDIKNTNWEDYSELYCSCISAVTKLMNENKDYDKAMGSYGIEGYNKMSVSEKWMGRAKGIMLYNLSPTECSSFGDPDFYPLLFSEAVLNLCKN